MRLQSLSFIIVFCLIIESCSINGTLQGYYSYQSQTEEKAPSLIQHSKESICELQIRDSVAIFAINGVELRDCLLSIENSLVYLWKPKCSSDICISPKFLQKICDNEGLELFIVAEYYDFEMMNFNYQTERPIFGINDRFYKSSLTKIYIQKFFSDLIGQEYSKENNNFFLFRKGVLVQESKSVDGVVAMNL